MRRPICDTMIKHVVWTILPFLVTLAGCSERKSPDLRETKADSRKIDACTLLTGSEIEAIQGAPVKEVKSSEKTDRGIVASQCYFMLPKAADSLTVTVLHKADGAEKKRGPRQVWQETFHRDGEKRKGGEEEERESARPEKIDGLGEEAFWTGLQFGGTLHVLKGDNNIRISVGGPGDEATKVQRLKALAELILKRL